VSYVLLAKDRFFDLNADPALLAAIILVATDRGFVSMCAHNAAREAFIRKPLEMKTEEGVKIWNPLTGQILPVLTRETPAERAPLAALPESPVASLPVFAGGK
jgi:hypothetical protein